MQKHELKLESRLGLGKLAKRVLRLWRANMQSPTSSIGEEDAPANIYAPMQASAVLNAERKKAEALMEWQRCRFSCV